MPSRAIGMGMCPRCGRPGTVVIKAGNYVYVKHGNTWHYIGTIDKVNLNKILIKNDENIIKVSKKKKNIFLKERRIIALLLITVIVLSTYAIYNIVYQKNKNNATLDDTKYSALLSKCKIVNNLNNSVYQVSCGSISLLNANNISVNYLTSLKNLNITVLNSTSNK